MATKPAIKAKPRAKKAVEAFTRKAYILRTCDKNMRSYGGFQWPTSGMVSAPDWAANQRCGQGLHGFLNGEGDADLASSDANAKWVVAEIEEWIDLGGKVKFPRAKVVHVGDPVSASRFLNDAGIKGAIVRGTATAGDGGTATAGYGGTATAGDGGTATAGYGGTATAGYGGTATAGDGGTATAGDGGTATAGDRGTATAGVRGTATAGYGGTATAGDGGIIIIRSWDDKAGRYRIVEGYVGENGVEANKPYRVGADGKLAEAA